MGFVVADTGNSSFKQVPAGVHIGRCFKLVDLGTQEETYEGETKFMRKLCVYWELHGDDDDGNPLANENGEPLVIWQEYTASLGKKSKLRAALESWRGRQFTEDELKGFDTSKLLNAHCMVNVTMKTSKTTGKEYSQVSSLTPLPSAIRNAKPLAVFPNVLFSVDEFDQEVFDTFHDKLKERISACQELKRREESSPKQRGRHEEPEHFEDDIPY